MNCNEYREKFIHGEMTPAEKKAFEEHLKQCNECRIFVERYENVKSFMKARIDYVPSSELKEKVLSKVKKRQKLKKLYMASVSTAAVIVIGAFFVWKPFTSSQRVYQRVASTGIEMLKSTSAASSSVERSDRSNDFTYMIHIKDVSDQF